METINTAEVADFASRIGVMKPNQVKDEDVNGQKRLKLLLSDPKYALEEKVDGCRYKMVGSRFFSADNVEKTDNFPHLKEFFEKLAMFNLVLDGETHYPGKTSQYATHVTGTLPKGAIEFQERNGYIHYTIFDILRTPKGNWTTKNTYLERRKLVTYLYDTYIGNTPLAEYIHLVDMHMDNKEEVLEGWLEAGKEGGVLKHLDSLYHMGKKPMWQWMKVKQADDTDLFIMGYEPPKIHYTGSKIDSWPYWKEVKGEEVPVTKFYFYGWIGSLILGAYVDGVVTQICTASGMNEALRKDISENSEAYMGKVARVTFMEKTSAGYPRHPAFKNMHETKQAHECIWEFE